MMNEEFQNSLDFQLFLNQVMSFESYYVPYYYVDGIIALAKEHNIKLHKGAISQSGNFQVLFTQ